MSRQTGPYSVRLWPLLTNVIFWYTVLQAAAGAAPVCGGAG
jgi:hypothetical protein